MRLEPTCKVTMARRRKNQPLEEKNIDGEEQAPALDGTSSPSQVVAKPVRSKKKAKTEPRATKSARDWRPKKSKARSKKLKELRADSQADYLRFLMGDPSVVLPKKRASKARPSQIGLTPSILAMLGPGSSSQAASTPPTEEKAPEKHPHRQHPSARQSGRVGLGLIDESDREMLDKADSIVVAANAENFVDFSSLEAKRRGSGTMLQRVDQYYQFESPAPPQMKADDDDGLRELFRAEVKLPGILNQNISLEFAGDVLIVIAYRAKDKKRNARKITEIVEIPSHVDVASLRVGRRPNGTLWIEEWTADPDDTAGDQLKRDMNFYLTDEYTDDREARAVATIRGRRGPGLASAPGNSRHFSLRNL